MTSVLTDVVPAGMTYDGIVPFAQTGGTAAVAVHRGGRDAHRDVGYQFAHWRRAIRYVPLLGHDRRQRHARHGLHQHRQRGLERACPATSPRRRARTTPSRPSAPATPANPGADLNNYRASGSADVNVPLATVTKTDDRYQPGPHRPASNVAIGEIVTLPARPDAPRGHGAERQACRHAARRPGLRRLRQHRVSRRHVDRPVGDFDAACNARTNPTVGAGGQPVTFDLGIVTNANRDNGHAETITITYGAVVLNVAGNVHGTTLHNSAVLSWTGSTRPPRSAPDVTVVEPIMTLDQDRGPGHRRRRRHDHLHDHRRQPERQRQHRRLRSGLVRHDPGGLTYVPGVAYSARPAPARLLTPARWPRTFDRDLADHWRCQVPRPCTFRSLWTPTSRPGQQFTNTASLIWTSLPGDYHRPAEQLQRRPRRASGPGIRAGRRTRTSSQRRPTSTLHSRHPSRHW